MSFEYYRTLRDFSNKGKIGVPGGFMFKRMVLVITLGVFLNLSAFAMVSFYIVETGVTHETGNKQHSLQWEDAFLDVFFEAGHIVSNAPIMQMAAKPAGDILQTTAFDIMGARSGGIDYIIIAILDYIDDSPFPEEITFFIYRVNTNEKLFEEIIQGKTYRNAREEFEDLKAIVRGLVPHIRI